jgi:hypothetical protein
MNVSINTVLKNICRAGNATCMNRSIQDDMNGPLHLPSLVLTTQLTDGWGGGEVESETKQFQFQTRTHG